MTSMNQGGCVRRARSARRAQEPTAARREDSPRARLCVLAPQEDVDRLLGRFGRDERVSPHGRQLRTPYQGCGVSESGFGRVSSEGVAIVLPPQIRIPLRLNQRRSRFQNAA
jgi:hypothetical protein